jgi:hypothetical protein
MNVVRDVIQPVYDRWIRPHVPVRSGPYTMAGVPVPAAAADPRAPKVLDATWFGPGYKTAYLNTIKNHVDDGDDVGIIGAGRGVSSVIALRQGATVTGYEAAGEMLPIARQTVAWQGYDDAFELVHALVGTDVVVYGDDIGPQVDPGDLEHDVLLLDCEGAEADILPRVTGQVEEVVVETHPERGVPASETFTALEDAGWDALQVIEGAKAIIVGQRGERA